MPKRAIMFDLDGTLLDTLADLGDSMNHVLSSQGFPTHDYAFYKKAVGDGAPELVSRSLPPEARRPDILSASLIHLRDTYEQCWTCKTRPYDGIPELLAQLGQRGIPFAVLSNKPHPKTCDCVAHFFPEALFARVQGALPGVPLKPDAQAALTICNDLGIPPDDWLYVGDTNTDMQTAVNARLFAVGATWGFRDRQELLENGARVVIDSPEHLLPLLE